ncbi:MAG: response regulator [Granulosicoccus sp.]|nr:response regulator [Granulosicoccus sp.]
MSIESNKDIDANVRREQVRLIYAQGPTLVLGATLCGALITVFLWRNLPKGLLLVWLAALCISALFRLFIMWRYNRIDSATRASGPWGFYLWAGTLSAGLIWGCWPVLFYEYCSPEYLLLISTVFAGMVAVSGASGSLFYPSFLSFSIPLVIPLALAHLFSGNELLRITGFLLLVFLIVNAFLAARGNTYSRELIRARFANQQLLDRLAEEKQIAERAVIAKSRFIAAASHDLRQPLHAMGLFLDALRNRESDPKQLGIIEHLSKSSEALNGLFNSILDVSRLDAEIIEFKPSHFRAISLLNRLDTEFSAQANEKGIKLLMFSADAVLYSDQILLERVLRNLLSNAIQYTEVGQVKLHCAVADGSVRISVSDTGLGIPEEAKDDVFSEYYQLNNPERDRTKGLGLGLAIVRRLCALMDMPIHMDTTEGRGTTFEMRVPEGDPAELPVPSEDGAVPAQSRGQLVLVIDDEQQVLQSMKHTLENWGFKALLAESAKSAIQQMAMHEWSPAIILSDYRLRNNENGVDAVATVREAINQFVPAVIISGDTSPARLKEVGDSNLEMLHKPVAPEELRALLDRMLQTTTESSTSELSVALSEN